MISGRGKRKVQKIVRNIFETLTLDEASYFVTQIPPSIIHNAIQEYPAFGKRILDDAEIREVEMEKEVE